MINIVTPRHYLRGRGVLYEASDHVAAIAKKVLVLGGKTALEKAGDALRVSLDRAGVEYGVREYAGYPNHAVAKSIAEEARENGYGAVVAVGGGRVIDMGKSAAAIAGLPVIAVPTIAATCACFAAVTIMYTEDGVFTDAAFRQHSPVLVIADTDVLAAAPVRYLRAGIADSLAKWYEVAPAVRQGGDLYLRLALQYGALIRDVLEKTGAETADAVEQSSVEQGKVDEAGLDEAGLGEVLDNVFLVTGLCGSIITIKTSQGIAHPLYNALSHYPALRKRLHGEKVAFGLVTQGILGGEDEKDIIKRVLVLKKLKIPLTLRELGFGVDGDIETQLLQTAQRVKDAVPV